MSLLNQLYKKCKATSLSGKENTTASDIKKLQKENVIGKDKYTVKVSQATTYKVNTKVKRQKEQNYPYLQ